MDLGSFHSQIFAIAKRKGDLYWMALDMKGHVLSTKWHHFLLMNSKFTWAQIARDSNVTMEESAIDTNIAHTSCYLKKILFLRKHTLSPALLSIFMLFISVGQNAIYLHKFLPLSLLNLSLLPSLPFLTVSVSLHSSLPHPSILTLAPSLSPRLPHTCIPFRSRASK